MKQPISPMPQEVKEELLALTPEQRLDVLEQMLDLFILATPSGPIRNRFTNANIGLMSEVADA